MLGWDCSSGSMSNAQNCVLTSLLVAFDLVLGSGSKVEVKVGIEIKCLAHSGRYKGLCLQSAANAKCQMQVPIENEG